MISHVPLPTVLWSLTAAPLTWFLHLNALYAANTIACHWGVDGGLCMIVATAVAAVVLPALWTFSLRITDGAISSLSRSLTALSALAITWTSIAAVIAPPQC